MSWKQYQNELIVFVAFMLMFSLYLYKEHASSAHLAEQENVAREMTEIKEVVALKKIWADKNTGKKVESLKNVVPASKVKWIEKSKKVSASYTSLKPSELNKLSSKILNTPVIIEKLLVQKMATGYNVEFKCRW